MRDNPANLFLPTEASYKFTTTFTSPRASQVSTPLRQIHSYALSPRPKLQHTQRSTYSARSVSKYLPKASLPSVVVTTEVRNLVKEWIAALGFAKLHLDLSVSPRKDPFRNGVLACELVRTLAKRGVDGIDRSPHSHSAVEQNFAKALQTLAKCPPLSFNLGFLALAAQLATGTEDLLWGFYWSLYNAYPNVLPGYLEEVTKELPYDSVNVRRLEAALMAWLHGLGVTADFGFPDHFIDLLPAFRSGVMLCHIVGLVFEVTLEGVIECPVSPGGIWSNLRKALHVLQVVPGMSQKFVWGREKDIMSGNIGVIMGLLEDMCRCADGLPVRKPGPRYHSDGPYCGIFYEKKQSPAALKSSLKSRNSDDHFSQTATWKYPLVASEVVSKSFPSHNFTLGAEANDLFPGAKRDFPSDVVPSPIGKNMPSIYEEEVIETESSAFNKEIHQWLMDLGLTQYGKVRFDARTVPRLTNGVLLYELLEAVERTKIAGTIRSPKTTAGCRANVRKSLEWLSRKPTFPTELHYIEDQLVAGEGRTWRLLFVSLLRIYRYSIETTRRIRH